MTIIIDTRYGAMECLEGDSIVSTSLIKYGEWAQSELDLLSKIVRPGQTVLDVGSFLGTHTLAFAHMVGSIGKVHSFEPRRDIRSILERNVLRNGLSNVVLHPCALGLADATINIPAVDIAQSGNFGGLSINESIPTDEGVTEGISIKRLDDFVFDRLDFIKVDAEGMEEDVIAGGRSVVHQFRPVLFAECNDLEHGYQTLQQLIALDYQVYGVSSSAFNPGNYRASAENIFGTAVEISLLAVPKEQADSIVGDLDLKQFARICVIDDLNLLMLQKPQYPEEVLARCSAGRVLSLLYPSPLSNRLSANHNIEVAALRGVIADLEQRNSALDAALKAQRAD
ncbi:FkbM family methyltransferase [Polaromonas sp. P1(28)-8]|nr:FkbM family methyltransferase [Polaromonas sp. P1(28)-8]